MRTLPHRYPNPPRRRQRLRPRNPPAAPAAAKANLDDWCKERLRALLHRAKVEERIEHQGVEVDLVAKLVVKSNTGE